MTSPLIAITSVIMTVAINLSSTTKSASLTHIELSLPMPGHPFKQTSHNNTHL